METAPTAKKSDLGVRTLSAIVMLAVAGTALWLGGWWWTAFVVLVAIGVWFEWSTLVLLFKPAGAGRIVWRVAGAIYCGMAGAMLIELRLWSDPGLPGLLAVVGGVIAIDVFAYAFGRTFKGPKIAPRISPSKTWAGLIGAIVGASLVLKAYSVSLPSGGGPLYILLLYGLAFAIVAQAGDFFESWMKRRAGVKDSGNLVPGHGGLFDRVDGLLAVCFVLGVIFAVSRLWQSL